MWNPGGTFFAARCNELVTYCTNEPGAATCPTCIDDFNAEVASKHLGREPGPLP